MKTIPRFYKNKSDFQKIHHSLKQYPCPHCDQIGTLNLHGLLKGLSNKKGNHKVIRGRRVYCSKRGNRSGCGRTFSIILYNIFKKYIVTANTLWEYLKEIANGKNIFQTFHSIKSIFTISTIYRLIKMVILNQPNIRTLLINKHAPPKKAKTAIPLIETIQHLKYAFQNKLNPISAFQIHFQSPLI